MTRRKPVWCIIGASIGFTWTLTVLLLVVGVVSGGPVLALAQAPRSPTPAPEQGGLRVEIVARGLEHPWALAFLPDGRQLVFVWDRASSPTVELRLTRPGKRVTAYELDGGGAAWADFDGRVIGGVKLTMGEVRMFEVEGG